MAKDDVAYAGKPKQSIGQRISGFGRTIWNGDTNEFIGRTASSWGKIGLFYMIFYSCLAGFFAAMLYGFFSTIDLKEPTQQNMYSLIKLNPGMGFRPMITHESTLIRFNSKDPKSYKEHIANLNQFISTHGYKYNEVPVAPLSVDKVDTPSMDMDPLTDECSALNDYGYRNGTPCVLLKINRVYNWDPVPFDNLTLETTEMGREAHKRLGDRFNPDYVGISCEGENDADIDNLGPVEYYPREGFPIKYFPYKNDDGYKSPLVFVKFNKLHPGAVIQVWCKLWVQNIKHHKNDKGGSVHFELLVD